MTQHTLPLFRRVATIAAALALVGAAAAAPEPSPIARPIESPRDAAELDRDAAPPRPRKLVSGRLNLNTAAPAQLELLPGIGPAKAQRIVAWRQKNGGFRRVADLRKVKGFGYKTVRKLEPYLDVKGDTTLAPAR